MIPAKVHFSYSGWHHGSGGKAHFRGQAFIGPGSVTAEGALVHLPLGTSDLNLWGSALSELNGFFSVVCEIGQGIMLAVDRVRSLPLYYSATSRGVWVSDNAEWIRRGLGLDRLDETAAEEFSLTGYVTGQDTLFPALKQVQAGEVVYLDPEDPVGVQSQRWYRFTHSERAEWGVRESTQKLTQAAQAAVQRLVDLADGRQIVIPLSGGLDSRLIALFLHRLGYTHVLCYTYGRPSDHEVAISRQIAAKLGLEWHCVEYDRMTWKEAWATPAREKYQEFAGGWSVLPHIQDWLAVREMSFQGLLKPGCVIAPGHSGDFVGGSHIPLEYRPESTLPLTRVAYDLFRNHYSLAPLKQTSKRPREYWEQQRIQPICRFAAEDPASLAAAYEEWDWQERQAKFIVNSVRVYEVFGYQWWLPLWDAEFIQFWQKIPLSLRLDQRWYREWAAVLDWTGVESTNIGVKRPGAMWKRMIPGPLASKARGLKSRVLSIDPDLSSARFPKGESQKLQALGYTSNGIAAHFFLKEAVSYLEADIGDTCEQ